ncbi:MAG TPA: TonB-dependent receptor [Bryobacteraceae bacterium]|nr:TonB-dependent receptor [Bryobacteraceae bacterium]
MCLSIATAASLLSGAEVVVVTGSYDPVPLEEADRPIRAIDVRNLSLVSNTFADVLKLDSSLDLRQRAPNGIQSDLSIRGAGFGQTLILLDGLRLNDVQSGHHNLDIPAPMEAIQRVEVLKGSGSTLYGSDAVGGVVNLITHAPERTEMRLRTALGNFGVNQQRGVLSYAAKKWAEELTFSRDFSTGFIENRDFRNLSMSSRTSIGSSLGTTAVTLAANDRPFGAEQFYGNFNSWERTRTWFASARQSLGDKTDAAFAFRRHTDLFVLYRDRPEAFTNRHAVESYQANVRRREEFGQNWKLFYGVELYRDNIQSNNLGNHERTRSAPYIALDVRAVKRFSFSVGLRDEIYSSFNHELSPSLTVGYWLAPAVKIRASASRAFRLPSYTDLYYQDPANRGTPDLRPEKAWSYEGGIDWNAGGRVRSAMTIFHRREQDGIDYVRNSPTDIWRAINFQRLQFTGVEGSVAYRPTSAHEIEWQYTGLRGAQDALDGQLSKYVFNYPVHSGVVTWQGAFPRGIIGRTRIGVLQRYQRDTYGLWDIYTASSRGRFRPFLQLSNVTNTSYEEIPRVAMPGRSFVAGFELLVFASR